MAETFSIFILKPKPDSLKSAENFLKNRNWKVGTGVNLREALAYMIQKKPDFIMIPSDHPNKKVRILPKILAQTFPVKIIVYCESSAGNAIATMHEMGCEYTLFPPVSGPSIERIALKIQRDEEKRKKEAEERKAMGLSDNSPDTIRLKGEAMTEEQRNSSFEQARAALTQLMSNEGDDAPGTYVAKGDGPAGNFGGYTPNDLGDANSARGENESYAQWEERMRRQQGAFDPSSGSAGSSQAGSSSSGSGSNAGFGTMGSMGGDAQGSGSQTGNGYFPQGSGNSSSGPGAMGGMGQGLQGSGSGGFGGGADSGNWTNSKNDPNFGPSFSGMDPVRRDKNDAPLFEQEPGTRKKKQAPRYKHGDRGSSSDLESIIVKGTQQALDETVVQVEGQETYQEIEKASHCACIVIESERFSGYLIAAMGKDRKIDQSFMTMIRQRLFAFLRAHGEVPKSEDSMSIKIQEVEFEDWAVEQADFLRKSIHEGDEVAMAFFPSKETHANLEESVSENMLKMQIDELKGDIAVEFDLYIYMPDNKKYLLYTQQGRPLYGDQKQRLTERGITHMHLRKESAADVKKYRVQNFLNEKIAAFKTAQNLKG